MSCLNRPQSRRRRAAFSLLELLAVVIILGILAAALIPRIVTSTDSAKQKAHLHNVTEINQAVERFLLDNDALPGSISDLETVHYFPDGIPKNPLDNSDYELDAVTKRVVN